MKNKNNVGIDYFYRPFDQNKIRYLVNVWQFDK